MEAIAERATREAGQVASGYRPSVTPADVERAQRGEVLPDPRRVTVGRLFVECRAVARQRGKGLRRSEVESVAAEMALRVVDRAGKVAPLRRDFLDPDTGRVSRAGRNILLGALRATLDAPSLWRETPPQEEPMDPDADLASLAAAERVETEGRRTIPDASAEELAHMMGCTETAARVVVAAGSFLVESHTAHGRSWRIDLQAASAGLGIPPSTLKVRLSEGKGALRKLYPDPAALLDALGAAGEAAVQVRADQAAEALEWTRDTGRDMEAALAAARAYTGALDESPVSAFGMDARAVSAAIKAIAAVATDYRKRAPIAGATDPGVTVRATRRNLRAVGGRPVIGPALPPVEAPSRVADLPPDPDPHWPTCPVPWMPALLAERAHAHRMEQRALHGADWTHLEGTGA